MEGNAGGKRRGRLDSILRTLMAETASDSTGETLARRFWEEVLVGALEREDVGLILEILDRHDGPLDRPARPRERAGAGHA